MPCSRIVAWGTVDSATGIAGGAGNDDAVDVCFAIVGSASRACMPVRRRILLRRARVESLAQPAVHDFGGNHVEVVLDGGLSARRQVFAPAQTRVFASEIGCDPARVGAESAGPTASNSLKQLDGDTQPIGCLSVERFAK